MLSTEAGASPAHREATQQHTKFASLPWLMTDDCDNVTPLVFQGLESPYWPLFF